MFNFLWSSKYFWFIVLNQGAYYLTCSHTLVVTLLSCKMACRLLKNSLSLLYEFSWKGFNQVGCSVFLANKE